MDLGLKKITAVFKNRKKLIEMGIGTGLLLIVSLVSYARILDPFEMLFLDLRFRLRGQETFPSNICIVGFDEASLDAFGRWPWPRDKHAALIDLLNRNSFRPTILAYDVLFENKNASSPQGDDALVYHAKKMAGNLLMSYFFEKGPASSFERDEEKEKRLHDFAIQNIESLPENIDNYDKVSLPFEELAQLPDLAFVNTPTDPDGRSRKVQLLARYDGRVYPSMDLTIAIHQLGATLKDVRVLRDKIIIESKLSGRREIPINSRGEMVINYYGAWDAIPALSFLALMEEGKGWMNGAYPQLLRSMKNKAVLVGVTALGIGDRRTTPFNRYEPGVSLHAQAVANILQNHYLVRAPLPFAMLTFFVLGIAVIIASIALPIKRSIIVVGAIGLAYFLWSQMLFSSGVWLEFAAPLIMIVHIFIGITSFQYFTALEELKQAQEQLIQSAKMASLGQLSAGIAHEFRNILNAISLNVECCTMPNITPERLQKYLELYKKTVKSAHLILEGLLVFARKSESVKKPGVMKRTIEDTLLLVEKEMQRYQIQVSSELEEGPETYYDAGQIAQTVMNLMNNARDALKEKEDQPDKRVTVRLKYAGDKIILEIQDNGGGIPPQVMKRLFEPFVTSKPAGKGTGLGLSVCLGIVKNHGGTIKPITAQGKGTTWHIEMPKALSAEG